MDEDVLRVNVQLSVLPPPWAQPPQGTRRVPRWLREEAWGPGGLRGCPHGLMGFGLRGDPGGGVKAVFLLGLFLEGRVILCPVSLFLKRM